MYQFISTGENSKENARFTCYINDVALNSQLDFIEVLDVYGREPIERKIETYGDIPGRDGDLISEVTIPSRMLEVLIAIDFNNLEEAQTRTNKIKILFKDRQPVKIAFSDEKDYYFRGTFQQLTADSLLQRNNIYKIIFFCSDPYKRSEEKTLDSNGTGENLQETVTIPEAEAIDLEWLEFRGINSGDTVTIKNDNTGQGIYLQGLDVTGNASIGIDTMTVRGKSVTNKLDPSRTTWKKLQINPGDRLSVTGMSSVQLVYKEKLL